MRLIDADALIPLIQEERIKGKILDIIKALGDGPQAETLNQACDRHIKKISSSPTIDAVRVVRCKDCVNWSDDKTHHCPLVAWWNGANDYCSAGARKGVTDD